MGSVRDASLTKHRIYALVCVSPNSSGHTALFQGLVNVGLIPSIVLN